MNILFLYVSLPHLSETGVFIDLIKEFDKQGHSVKVVTPSLNGLDESLQIEAGVEVLRFKTDQLVNNSSNLKKGLAYMKLAYQFPNALKKYFGKEKFDLIIAHSLPTEIGIIAKVLKKRYKAPFYLMLCEYIWQDSVSLGFFKENGLICRYYKWLEKITVGSADYIGSPSQGNIDFTLKYYPWAKEKGMHVLHYSQAPIILKNTGEDIKAKYGLKDKFVAIYGGNMSVAQKIENVMYLAEACIEYEDIVFVLLGRGQEITEIKKTVKNRNITNITFIDFLPKDEYNNLLSVCNVGLVSLNENLAIPNIPSKTMSYFNLSIPIVASIDRNTDYGLYLESAGAGLWSYAGDTDMFKENLLKLYNSPQLCKEMGENGYRFYVDNMLPEVAYATIMKQLK